MGVNGAGETRPLRDINTRYLAPLGLTQSPLHSGFPHVFDG